MTVGDSVRFREHGQVRAGTITAVVQVGRLNGTGVQRLRLRARIRCEEPGAAWETHRDLDELDVEAQPSLFADEANR